MKVCIFDKTISEQDIAKLNELGGEALCCCVTDADSFPHAVYECDILIVLRSDLRLEAKTISKMKNCFAIIRASVGYDNIDIIAAGKQGICVFNVPDYGTADVADHVVALFLSYIKRICIFNDCLHGQGQIWNPLPGNMPHRISTLKFGIVGLGWIGSSVALRMRAFGVEIFYYDPYLPDGYEQVFMVHRVSELQELFEICDVISIHTPLTSETEGMITLSLLSKSKKRPIIINCARGKIIANATIIESLKQNLVEAYLLDTIEIEPIKSSDDIYIMANQDDYRNRLLITPHAASYDIESRRDMHTKAICIVEKIFNGKEVGNCVNKQYLTSYRKNIKIL